MRTRAAFSIFRPLVWAPLLAAAGLLALLPRTADAQLVNIATDATDPFNFDDSEPSITVNPLNPLEIAVVSFAEGWGPENPGPVWKSNDGGTTWRKVFQLPQPDPGSGGPGDQKITFDGAGHLHVAELGMGIPIPRCMIFRQTAGPDDPLTPGMLYCDDQPHLEIDRSPMSGFLGRLYSPWLDFAPPNERSTVSRSVNAGINMTDVGAGDNSSFPNRTTRIALAPDGRAYIIYKTREGGLGGGFESAHFRVNRSDDGGVTWNGLGAGGVSVHGAAQVQTWFTSSWGNSTKGKVARARSSDAWIAADPGDGDIYAAYVDQDASGFGQIFVARSTNGGLNWTSTRVTDGTHHSAYPEIAVAANGAVGVLYVDFDDSGNATLFRHRFARSFNDGATWVDQNLQTMDPTPLANAVDGFLWGDYEGLTAVGHTFYGVFTGASIGRATPQLDPIFFKASAVPADQDFYVRDWTDTAASGDDGAEPSTHSVFHSTSDVWNLRSNVAPAFNANNQPVNENPQNGPGAMGDNFAFARIFRNTAGPAATVTAHFLFSEFGVGSNYQDAGAPAGADVSFAAGDVMKVMATGHPWHLGTTVSTHLCLATEISTSTDPFSPPTLLGRAPGWPTTDLMVIHDNNKAQRNMGVYPYSEAASNTYYAVIHNPAVLKRDVTLSYTVPQETLSAMRGSRLGVVGGPDAPLQPSGTLVLPAMQPGENRWIGLSLGGSPPASLAPVQVTFFERVGTQAVNGFTIAAQPVAFDAFLRDTLELHVAVLTRLVAVPGGEGARGLLDPAVRLLSSKPIPARDYLRVVQDSIKPLAASLAEILRISGEPDPFGTEAALKDLEAAGDARTAASAHAALLHKLDALLTKIHKARGDTADILQTVRWQDALYARNAKLSRLTCAKDLAETSARFVRAYQSRKATSAEYPDLIRQELPCFRETARAISPSLDREIDEMDKSLGDPTALQGAHRRYLLKLVSLVGP